MAKRGHFDLTPSGILSRWRAWASTAQWVQTQMPEPLSEAEQYAPPLSHLPVPLGKPVFKRGMVDFDYGANAFAIDIGRLTSNPIGAGVIFTHPLPIMPEATAQVINHTMIFWRAQMINGGVQPEFGPLYTPRQLQTILGPLAQAAVLPPQNPGLPNF